MDVLVWSDTPLAAAGGRRNDGPAAEAETVSRVKEGWRDAGEATDADPERLGHPGELRLVREARVDEGLGLGHAPRSEACARASARSSCARAAQGGRGKGALKTTFGPEGDEAADRGVWMSIWVDDVDAVHRRCVEQGLEVTWPPTDMPWNVREMHVRHPDGHVFRISRGLEESEP